MQLPQCSMFSVCMLASSKKAPLALNPLHPIALPVPAVGAKLPRPLLTALPSSPLQVVFQAPTCPIFLDLGFASFKQGYNL